VPFTFKGPGCYSLAFLVLTEIRVCSHFRYIRVCIASRFLDTTGNVENVYCSILYVLKCLLDDLQSDRATLSGKVNFLVDSPNVVSILI
jgi:hypothetical protein